jgi:hypothetical protein
VLPTHLFLITVAERTTPTRDGLVPLSLNEIRHLFAQPGIRYARQRSTAIIPVGCSNATTDLTR